MPRCCQAWIIPHSGRSVWLNAVIRALIAFTEAMRAKTRDDDLVTRLGGEEFCVLLPRIGVAEAGQVAARIRA